MMVTVVHQTLVVVERVQMPLSFLHSVERVRTNQSVLQTVLPMAPKLLMQMDVSLHVEHVYSRHCHLGQVLVRVQDQAQAHLQGQLLLLDVGTVCVIVVNLLFSVLTLLSLV